MISASIRATTVSSTFFKLAAAKITIGPPDAKLGLARPAAISVRICRRVSLIAHDCDAQGQGRKGKLRGAAFAPLPASIREKLSHSDADLIAERSVAWGVL